ncbi:MAG: hypothetical protein ABR905_11155 [Terracidiphilus sp.]|jgi:flagellin-specific chaperone FliS
MAESYLDFATRETQRLDGEIEGLQEMIRLHNQTKDAWDTIMRNAAGESQAACLKLANSETLRLNGEIEAVHQEILRHADTREAWETILRKSGSETRVHQGVTYVKGEDGQWHQQRLDMEVEGLQRRIHVYDETKDAWNKIVRNAEGDSKADCLDVANAETARLNKEIEAVQEEIRRCLETRNAWDTIMRNSVSESRIYQGAMYMRGWDGQWHLQQTEGPVLDAEGYPREAGDPVSKVNSVLQGLLDACEKTFRGPQKHADLQTNGAAQFQSLGLR